MTHEEVCLMLGPLPIKWAIVIANHDQEQREYIRQLELRLGVETLNGAAVPALKKPS